MHLKVLLVLSIFVLVGCSTQPVPAQPTQDSGYPLPKATLPAPDALQPTPDAAGSGYPGIAGTLTAYPTSTVLVVPTASAARGVVHGKVVFKVDQTAIARQDVYLGDYLPLTPGPKYAITMRELSSPHSLTDENGEFVIADVLPGQYPLIVWSPFHSQVVLDSSGTKELLITVIAGQTVELGKIAVNWPK